MHGKNLVLKELLSVEKYTKWLCWRVKLAWNHNYKEHTFSILNCWHGFVQLCTDSESHLYVFISDHALFWSSLTSSLRPTTLRMPPVVWAQQTRPSAPPCYAHWKSTFTKVSHSPNFSSSLSLTTPPSQALSEPPAVCLWWTKAYGGYCSISVSCSLQCAYRFPVLLFNLQLCRSDKYIPVFWVFF